MSALLINVYLCNWIVEISIIAMTLILVLAIIGGLAIIAKTIMSDRTQPRQVSKPSIVFEYNGPEKRKTTIQKREDGAFVLNGGTSSQITLIGATIDDAHTIKKACDSIDTSSYYDAVNDIKGLLLEKSIQVEEVISFQKEVRPIVERRVQKLISEDEEWESLGEMDKEDKKREYIDQSMVTFHDAVTPAMEGALSYLAMNSPIQVPLLDELIKVYGVRNLNTYNSYRGRKHPIISIPNANYRKPLEDLVKVGLAGTGYDMGVEEMLSSLTLNELNDISGAETKFTRKDKAIKYIAEKDNVASIIEKNIALRSLFVLKPLPSQYQDFDFDKFQELVTYYESLADVVVSVYNGLSPISFKKR